jgi:hypothetical protein
LGAFAAQWCVYHRWSQARFGHRTYIRQLLRASALWRSNSNAALFESCRLASFISETVYGVGFREVEMPQRIGIALNLLLRWRNFLDWITAAIGCSSLDYAEGGVAQTRAGSAGELK